jgi:hypothetical protein
MKTIRRGQFYGQPLATCLRTILEMRRSAGGEDVASVNELYAALKEGGYAFEAKDDENAKNGVRISLRKNSQFHRIPSGDWGLRSWYPNIKAEKDDSEDKDQDDKKSVVTPASPPPTPNVDVSVPPVQPKKKEKPVNEQAASAS